MVPLLVPTPTRLVPREGGFLPQPSTRLHAIGAASAAGDLLRDLLTPTTGLPLTAAADHAAADHAAGDIRLAVVPDRRDLGPEGYQLVVDELGIDAVAGNVRGLGWAVQTLRQLLPPAVYHPNPVPGVQWLLPAVAVTDVPRFSWRGLMIDLARWFRPLPEVRRLIDLAAMHKLNVLHFHLTDDQGWRFESLRYPRLTEIGGWRPESMVGPAEDETFDGIPHGGSYTQAELRDLVSYAARLGVTLVPEIDVPGHTRAAIAAYPELGNDPDRRLETGTRWGIFSEVLNVEDSTVAFVTDVLDEVMDVFPSPFIHVGGDECPRTEWAASARA